MSEPHEAAAAGEPPPDAPPPPATTWGPGYAQPLGYGPTPGQGQPQYDQPAHGQPAYGQPQYGQPLYGQPQYGQATGAYVPPPAQRGIVPLRPLSLGEIFDGAFRSVRANPRVMFGFSAIVVTISVIIQTVIQWYTMGPLMSMLTMAASPDTEDLISSVGDVAIGYTVVVLLMLVASTVLTGLLITSVSRSVIGERVGPAEVWRMARPQLWRLLVLTLLITVGSLVVPALWIATLLGLGLLEQPALFAVVFLLGGLGVLVWFAWVYVRTLLATPALVLERHTVVAGFKRGWQLSQGSFWRLLGIYLLAVVIVYVVASIIGSPAGIVAAFMGPTYFTSPVGLAVTAVTSLLASVVTTPFTAAVVALLYIDTRMRREGLDVELTRAAEATAAGAQG